MKLADHPNDQHVTPQIGRVHENSRTCWCEPSADPVTFRGYSKPCVWLHKHREIA